MKSIITAKGLTLLKERLKDKKEFLRQIQEEKAHAYSASGDGWHDNPGWTQLGQQEEMLSTEIVRLEQHISNATLLDLSMIDENKVQIGGLVTYTLRKKGSDKEAQHQFQIVGAGESDIKQGKISYDSPIGKALYNLQVGEKKEVSLPNGSFMVKILSVRYE